MGAVHGVYLKYVGLSAASYFGYSALMNRHYDSYYDYSAAGAGRTLMMDDGEGRYYWWYDNLVLVPAATMLGYSAFINGSIAMLFQLRKGMGLVGKDGRTGKIPIWSYVIFFPFHLPTMMYTYVHTRMGTYMCSRDGDGGEKDSGRMKVPVPVASEVLPGWWIGGRYSHELNRHWAGIVDLTVEFPELCETDRYLLLPVWDGVPPNPSQLEEAATFAAEASKHGNGDVLIHCAHGRGRSTTVMCAAIVKAGLYPTWQEAFDAIKPGRPVIKLNGKMRASLAAWQKEHVDGKKRQ